MPYSKIKVGRASGYPVVVTQGKIEHEAILLGCDDDPAEHLTNNIEGKVKVRWIVAGYNDSVAAKSVRMQNVGGAARSVRGRDGVADEGAGEGRKPEAVMPPSAKMAASMPKHAVGTTVSKNFYDDEIGEERPFSGKVTAYDADEKLYKIEYEDGDTEELDEGELSMIACAKGKQNIGKKQKRKNKVPEEGETTTVKKQRSTEVLNSRTPRRSAKIKVSYAESDSDDMDFEEEDSEDEVPKKMKSNGRGGKSAKGKTARGKGKKKRANNSDSEEFELGSEPGDDSSESDFDVDSEEEDYAQKKGKKDVNKPTGKKAGSSGTNKGEGKRKMADMFTPMNNPTSGIRK